MTNILDEFDKKLKKRLSELEIKPEMDMWSRIDNSLNEMEAQKRPAFLRRVIISTTIAASLLIGVLFIFNHYDNNEVVVASSNEIVIEEEILTFDEVEEDNHTQLVKKETSKQIVKPVVDKIILPSEDNVELKIEKKKVKEQKATEEREVYKNDKEIASVFYDKEPHIKKSVKKNSWSLAINGSGSLISSSANNALYDTEVVSFSDEVSDYNVYRMVERDWVHNLPISFSISVRKMINRKIGIESGIQLTYLSSYSNGGGDDIADLKNKITYIGVPISVVYSLVDNDKFGLYAKTGILVDKAVNATRYSSLDGVNTQTNLSKEGVQLSYNINVGGEYKLTNKVFIYLEPSISVYGENNQPISYRTENRYGISVLAGLRWEI